MYLQYINFNLSSNLYLFIFIFSSKKRFSYFNFKKKIAWLKAPFKEERIEPICGWVNKKKKKLNLEHQKLLTAS